LQGPRKEFGHECIRTATKACHGLFPKRLVLEALTVIAREMGCQQVLAVCKDSHIYSSWRYRKEFQADYDSFWLDIGAEKINTEYFRIPFPIPRKPMEEIASKKRSEYNRRYALDEMAEKKCAAADLQEKHLAFLHTMTTAGGAAKILMHQGIGISRQFANGVQCLHINPAILIHRIRHMHMADFTQHQRTAARTMSKVEAAMQHTLIAHWRARHARCLYLLAAHLFQAGQIKLVHFRRIGSTGLVHFLNQRLADNIHHKLAGGADIGQAVLVAAIRLFQYGDGQHGRIESGHGKKGKRCQVGHAQQILRAEPGDGARQHTASQQFVQGGTIQLSDITIHFCHRLADS
jgi:hypothetical protein